MGSDVIDDTEAPEAFRLQWRRTQARALLYAIDTILAASRGEQVDPLAVAWAENVYDQQERRCCYCGKDGHLSKDCDWPNGREKG